MTRRSIKIELNGVEFHHTGAGPWSVKQCSFGHRFEIVNEQGENRLRVSEVKPHPDQFIFFTHTAAQAVAEALNTGAAAGAPPSSFYERQA